MRLVGVGRHELGVGGVHVLPIDDPDQLAFGPACVGLARQQERHLGVGSLEAPGMLERLFAGLLQKDLEDPHVMPRIASS